MAVACNVPSDRHGSPALCAPLSPAENTCAHAADAPLYESPAYLIGFIGDGHAPLKGMTTLMASVMNLQPRFVKGTDGTIRAFSLSSRSSASSGQGFRGNDTCFDPDRIQNDPNNPHEPGGTFFCCR
jgi:hypothetical protein